MSDSRTDNAALRLAAIVEHSDDAIISKDLDGIVESWNQAAERILGFTAEEMIGQSIRRIIPAERQSEEDHVLGRIRRGDRVDHFETIRCRKDGSRFPVSITVSPIIDGNGRVIGASKILRDISDRKRIEHDLAVLHEAEREQAAVTARMNQVAKLVASTLSREPIVRAVTDATAEMIDAEFAAFYYNPAHPSAGDSYVAHSAAGATRESFTGFPNPEAAPIFAPTFQDRQVVRASDITLDPRYGRDAPYFGVPGDSMQVRSYLAVPVTVDANEVVGGLFFGHSAAGVFTEQHEDLATGMAAWASVALENARLYVRAQQATRLRDEFLATLSHELRTPLNAIVGYTRMMRSGLLPQDKQARAVETVERNATALTQIVEDVLDVSRIISGKIRLNVQPVDLATVVREALDTVRPAADAKGVTLEADLDGTAAARIAGDAERLQQVFWNLLSNAVKFTGRGGTVRTAVEPSDLHVDVTVTDSGVGIPPEFLPHVFERFRQADASMSRERGGLGLGLAIARHLVELHGGTIEAASEGIGKGSTFRARLPSLAAHTESAGRPRAAARTYPKMPSVPVPDLSGICVLAVDDDRDALALVREILEAAGARIVTAESAAEALVLLERATPDVLLADLGMPKMNGFELITRVRKAARADVRAMPAAALTAYARSEDRARALLGGFQLHLSKPIDPRELMDAIATLARRAQLR